MSRDYKLYLEDILDAAHKIEQYTKGLSFQQFSKDQMRVDAVLRNLEIIGEATKNLPVDLRTKYSATNWRKVAGLRDIVIHAYFNVNHNIIWDIVQNKLPELRRYGKNDSWRGIVSYPMAPDTSDINLSAIRNSSINARNNALPSSPQIDNRAASFIILSIPKVLVMPHDLTEYGIPWKK